VTAKLCRSHIIPEFFYKPLYDNEHKIQVVSTEASENRPKIQKGLREYLLCERCESQFSGYETYASGIFYQDTIGVTQNSKEIQVHQVHYIKFKLFVMSLLWRMGISRDEFFLGVQLGQHEEQLRKALLTENPLTAPEYAFFIYAVFHQGKFMRDFTMQPSSAPGRANTAYRVVIAGFMFVIFTAPVGMLVDSQDKLFGLDGTLRIFREEAESIPYLDDFMLRQATARRTREVKGSH
jgi:hypothetical protein